MTAKPHPKPSIIYPESDGQPMTESDPTRDYLIMTWDNPFQTTSEANR